MVKLRITKYIAASTDFVYRWWTDLSDDDPKMVKPLVSRRIINKSQDFVEMEDVVKVLGHKMKYHCKVKLNPPSDWVAEYDGSEASATSTYKIFREEDGTRLEYSSEIRPKRILTKLTLPIVKGLVRQTFSKEMDDYISRLEQDRKLQT